ncbi:MAG: oxidoreductase [Gemmatimonas sp. SG8_38_2]|jgi:NADP-dependent 3-hydroxy acid dehydrogenase YdfG|nr:MAG: oxidoreductase [Gemmatimonas sp. SG8_38_2]
MSEPQSRVAVITGASSGIGAATAIHLSETGWRVVLGARREDRLQHIAQRIGASGGSAEWKLVDVTKRGDVRDLVELARERYGRLDAMVSNAGFASVAPLDALRIDDWERMVDVNIKGVLHGIAAALPLFRTQGHGHFVNIASTAGMKTVPNQAVYSGTKYAVRAISEGLRQEAGEHLRVTIISPGFVYTDFGVVPDDELRERLLAFRDQIAIPPESIARAIAYALNQPPEVDVGEIVIRPTAQA